MCQVKLAVGMAVLAKVDEIVALEKMELSSDVMILLEETILNALKMESSLLQYALSSHNDVHTHTHTHIYIYIYIICTAVCRGAPCHRIKRYFY